MNCRSNPAKPLNNGFNKTILAVTSEPLRALSVNTIQVNLGYRCNMACIHCHVNARPDRPEMMGRRIIDQVLAVLKENNIEKLDITGGAPELNPSFRYLVKQAKVLRCHIMVRTNLTIFSFEKMDDLPQFLSDNMVEVIASLPYYYEEDYVDHVRGKGTFKKSIEALRQLNDLGYGKDSTNLQLDLVFNSHDGSFPPSQSDLEEEYRKVLKTRYEITFNRLFTIINMPIGRFRERLQKNNELSLYMGKLRNSFKRENIKNLMCKTLINVGPDGRLYDCDFNQTLGLTVLGCNPGHINGFDSNSLSKRFIATGLHCFGCTASQGSS
jgi:radical SAM/Cys-rich protein